MTLDSLTDSRLWLVAGWTMLHFLWIGALVGIVAAVGRWLLRRRSANVRYLFALVVFAVLAALPLAVGEAGAGHGNRSGDGDQAGGDQKLGLACHDCPLGSWVGNEADMGAICRRFMAGNPALGHSWCRIPILTCFVTILFRRPARGRPCHA